MGTRGVFGGRGIQVSHTRHRSEKHYEIHVVSLPAGVRGVIKICGQLSLSSDDTQRRLLFGGISTTLCCFWQLEMSRSIALYISGLGVLVYEDGIVSLFSHIV